MLLMDLMEIAGNGQKIYIDTVKGYIEGDWQVLKECITGEITLRQVRKIEAMDDTLYMYLEDSEELEE